MIDKVEITLRSKKKVEEFLNYFGSSCLPILYGIEDKEIKGYEITIRGNKRIERFVKDYIPFILLKKE